MNLQEEKSGAMGSAVHIPNLKNFIL